MAASKTKKTARKPKTAKSPAKKTAEPKAPTHDCMQHAVLYEDEEGALGHGWTCGLCGALIQVG